MDIIIELGTIPIFQTHGEGNQPNNGFVNGSWNSTQIKIPTKAFVCLPKMAEKLRNSNISRPIYKILSVRFKIYKISPLHSSYLLLAVRIGRTLPRSHHLKCCERAGFFSFYYGFSWCCCHKHCISTAWWGPIHLVRRIWRLKLKIFK